MAHEWKIAEESSDVCGGVGGCKCMHTRRQVVNGSMYDVF